MRYLSPEWFGAAQRAVETDQQLHDLTAQLELTVEQTVTEGPDDTGPSSRPVQWHLVFDHGSVRLAVGPAERADLRFRAPYPVAAAIACGELGAAIAFVQGDLTVGGDLRLLTAHQRVLAAVGDVLSETRNDDA